MVHQQGMPEQHNQEEEEKEWGGFETNIKEMAKEDTRNCGMQGKNCTHSRGKEKLLFELSVSFTLYLSISHTHLIIKILKVG